MGTLLLLSLLALLTPPIAVQQTDPAWRGVIRAHLVRYPEMGVDDLYKLLHQGATGSEHAVPSLEAAREWLQDELDDLGRGPPEPMADTIAPGGTFVRIHLRPYVEAGGDAEALLEAFVETANTAVPGRAGLRRALGTAVEMAGEGLLPWDSGHLIGRITALEAQEFPAVHHTETFRSRYRPAYRVVAGDLVAGLLPARRPGPGLP